MNGSGGASVPGSGDVAIFDGGDHAGTKSGNCTINAAVNVAGFTVSSSYAGTISQGANTITIGTSNASFSVGTFTGGSAAITVNGTFTLAGATFTSTSGTLTLASTVSSTSGTFSNNSGTVDYSGGTQNIISSWTYNNLTCSGSGDKLAAGNLTVNGTLTINSSRSLDMSTSTLAGSFTTSGAGTLKTQNTGATPVPSGKTWNFDVQYNSASAQTIISGRYTNLNASNANRTLSSTDTVHVSGTFTPGAGTYTSTSSTLDFNGAAQSVPTISPNYNNLACRGSGTKTGTAALVINGTLNVASSITLDLATFALSGTLSTISGTGTIKTQETSSTPIPASKTWTQTIEYNGAAQSVVAGTYAGLTISGTGDKTATGAPAVSGVLTINSGRIYDLVTNVPSGAFTTSGTGTLKTQNTTSTPLPASKTWSFTVELNAAAQSVVAGTYANLTCSGSADKTATAAITVNGILAISNGILLQMGSNQLSGTISSTSGSGGIRTSNTGSTPIPSSKTWNVDVAYAASFAQTIVIGTYNNLSVGGLGTLTKTANGDLAINGLLTVATSKTLDMSTFKITGTPTTAGAGTVRTQNTSSTPLPAGVTWVPNVEYNSASAQTIVDGYYAIMSATGGDRTFSSADTIFLSGDFTPGSGTYTIGTSTVNYNGTGAQTIKECKYYNLIYSSTGNRTLSSTGTIYIANVFTKGSNSLTTTSSTVEYNGTGAQTIIPINYNNLTVSGSHAGNITFSSAGIVGIAGALVYSASHTSGGPVATGNTIDFNGGTQNIPSITSFSFNNLTCSGSGDKTATGALTVAGALTINSGRILDMGTNQLSGALTTSGSGTLKTQNTGSAPLPAGKSWTFTVQYNSTSAQNIVYGSYIDLSGANGNRTLSSTDTVHISGTLTTGSGTYTTASSTVDFNGAAQNVPAFTSGNYNNLKIGGTGTKTASAALNVGGKLTINSGRTFDMSTFQLSGSLTTSGAGTLQTQNTGATPITQGRTWVFPVAYNSSSVQTIVYGSYADLDGTNGNRTLSSTDTVHISGTFTTGTGTYTTTSSTVDFNGAAQNIPPFTSGSYNNLKAGGSGTKTGSGALIVDGILNVPSSRILDLATYALSGTIASTSGTGTIKTQNTSSAPVPPGETWTQTIEYNGGAQSVVNGTYGGLTCSGSGDKTANGAPTVNGILTINSGRILDLATYALAGSLTTSGTGTLKTQNTGSTPIPAGKTWSFDVQYNSGSGQTMVNGNFINLSGTGGDRTLSSTGTIAISGTFTTGAGVYTVVGSTVDFNGTSAQSLPALNFNNLSISGARSTNSVTLPSGTITVGGNLSFSATFSIGSIITTGNTMLFNSTSNQAINGSATATLGKLSVNKNSGKLRLYTPVTVQKQLILTEGIISTSATNYITVTAAADTTLGGSDSSYVSGPLKKIGNSVFTFTLGDTVLSTGGYHPLKITAPAVATDAFIGQYYATNPLTAYPADTIYQTDSIESVSTCEYFDLTRTAGTSTVIPTLGWNSNICNLGNYEDLRVAGWDGTQWRSMGNAGGTFTGSQGTLKSWSGISTAVLHMTFGAKPAKPLPYFILKRELDAGCYYTRGTLNFKFDEEYNDTDGLLEFTIYNDKTHTVKTTNQLIPIALPSSYGEKWFSLNLLDCDISPTGLIGNGYYILEVKNEKKEKWYLRFKQQSTGTILCTGTATGVFIP
jgi:hypothetical protein